MWGEQLPEEGSDFYTTCQHPSSASLTTAPTDSASRTHSLDELYDWQVHQETEPYFQKLLEGSRTMHNSSGIVF